MRARSGQVVVIGGLIQNESRDDTAGIPFVSRIPFLGRLFEHSRLVDRRTELVILLRPIVVAENAWGDALRTTSDRVRDVWRNRRESDDRALSLDGWLPPTPPVGGGARP